MLNESSRVAMGQSVLAIGAHYFAGLASLSIADAERIFPSEVRSEKPLAKCALRLAEHEVTHS